MDFFLEPPDFVVQIVAQRLQLCKLNRSALNLRLNIGNPLLVVVLQIHGRGFGLEIYFMGAN